MKNLESNSFAEFKYVNNPNISEDGRNIVYGITGVDLEENKYITNFHVYNIENKNSYQLTNSPTDSNFIFLKNNKILFSSSRDKKKNVTRFYEISLSGGEALFSFEVDKAVKKILRINDNKFILLASEFEDKEEDKSYNEIEDLPFWFNGRGFINQNKNNIYIYDKLDNKIESLIEDENSIDDVKYFENLNSIIFSVSDKDPNNFFNRLFILNLETSQQMEVGSPQLSHRFYDVINDKLVYLGSDMKKGGINENSHLYKSDLTGENIQRISSEEFDVDFYNSTGTDLRQGGGKQIIASEDKLYFVRTLRDRGVINSVDLEGNLEEIDINIKSIESFDILDGKFAYVAFDKMNLAELYYDGEKITNCSEALDEYKISPVEKFTFESDGNELDGYIIKPVDYKEGDKYPALLEIHGGPKTAYSDIIHHEMQLLASRGYFVFYTNPRGSSGRGFEFSDIRGKYGTIDYDDLMKLTDEVITRYKDIDENRLGVLGGSYGGFMTNWIIGHTNRFKAANTQRCISNWTSFYGVSDIGYYFATDQNASSPWENFDLLWEKSPIKHFDKVDTPTLIIHSDEDYRCPLEQGIQAYTALKVKGIDTKMVIFKGENHDLSRSGKPKNRIKRLDEIVEWFDKHL